MAEEHETEEGEIYDNFHVDIDVKIQTVLGDYMKDFEEVVSVETKIWYLWFVFGK